MQNSSRSIIMAAKEQKFERLEDLRSDSSVSIEKNDSASHEFNKRLVTKRKVLNPHEPLLQKWNKIFVITCVMAIFVDHLFFYISVINDKGKCLNLDETLKITACVLRTFFDLLYVLRIIFQFRTGFIAPSSRVFGRGELIDDSIAIMKRYLTSNFIIDILSIIPLPQMIILPIIPVPKRTLPYLAQNMLKYTIIVQYVPRLLRLYLLLKEITNAFGTLTETAWVGAAYNLLLCMLASHVVGAFWYLFSVESEVRCWHTKLKHTKFSAESYLSCGQHYKQDVLSLLNSSNTCPYIDIDPQNSKDPTVFDFGIFTPALKSHVVESTTGFTQKFFFCFWWGLRNLSSLGQNLLGSTYIWENIFAIFIAIFGLVLFSSLIGNMQKYLQSTSVSVEEMRFEEMKIKRREVEHWMSYRMIPSSLKERIRRYDKYKWQQNRGVEEEALTGSFPKDLRRDIKRHICLRLIRRVPMLEAMNNQLLDAMCIRMKPFLYTEDSYIVCEGDPVEEILFIMDGSLASVTTNGGRSSFFNCFLKAGDFCGEELLAWALDPNSSNLPISTRTVQTLTGVEAFVLMADDLKLVAIQFQRLMNMKQLQHTFRFYSHQWRTWAACFIQVAWRRYQKKKIEKALREAERGIQAFTSKDGLDDERSTSSNDSTDVGFHNRKHKSRVSLSSDGPIKKVVTRIKVLDPQGSLLQKWNKIFVITSVMAISVDPLFFYIPVINDRGKCLNLDKKLKITACVLRTFFDLFYVLHIIFQFRTGFIAPSSRVFVRGMLVDDTGAIIKRYLSSHFVIDILSIIPLPQMVILAIVPIPRCSVPYMVKNLLKYTVISQYVPRLLRLYQLFKEETKTWGALTETAWFGAAYNLLLYIVASHVIGASWYLLSVESKVRCWQGQLKHTNFSTESYLSCGQYYKQDVLSLLNSSISCPYVDTENNIDPTVFDFGIFTPALQSRVVESTTDFTQKFFFCFWWGLRNLIALGQTLLCSTYIWENIFAIIIAIFGLVLFCSLIANVQKYLHSATVKVQDMRFEEIKFKRRDVERWISHRKLPKNLKERIKRYEQYKWQENKGLEEEDLIANLPKDLRRDIKRHLCLHLLKKVPMLENVDKRLLDGMCDRLKPVLYTEKSNIVYKGDLIDEMIFVMSGKLASTTTNDGRSSAVKSLLSAGDFCGEELLTWALSPNSLDLPLPISNRTVDTISEVEAFALLADDLKFVVSQFRNLINSKQLEQTLRFFSQQWRTWAACMIQAAWRRYLQKKAERASCEAEELDAFANQDGHASSPSSATSVYVSRFEDQRLESTAITEKSGCISEKFLKRKVKSCLSLTSDGPTIKLTIWSQVIDPQGPLFQKWNKIFLITCVMAIYVDPLFFYLPVINDTEKCLRLDEKLKITACVLRTLLDLLYILRIIIQFRAGFIAPSSCMLGRDELIDETTTTVKKYLRSDFIIDILSIIPLPQVVILAVIPIPNCSVPYVAKNLLKYTIIAQYVPRLLRSYQLFKEVTGTSGILTQTWAGAIYNLFLYMLASHVVGSFWYLFSVESELRCWHTQLKHTKFSTESYLSCGQYYKHDVLLLLNSTTSCTYSNTNNIDPTIFNFGIFAPALQSRVVDSTTNFPQKFFFCFWWGLCNLSSLGQNLLSSTYIWENVFAIYIAIFASVLFASLIGNMEKYLQSTTVRVEEMRFEQMKMKWRDIEWWMSYRMLPHCLKERIRRYEQFKWQEYRGVDEEALILNLPKDLRRDIKYHLCSDLIRRVPTFKSIIDRQVLHALCYKLKPVLYTKNSCIVCEGDSVDEILFIKHGNLTSCTTNSGRPGFFYSSLLRAGDLCGEELLTWALNPNSSSYLPISTRTIETISEVEAFAIKAEDLKSVASQLRHLINSKHLQHTFRFYSLQWRTWAACFIQAAWRRYQKKRAKKNNSAIDGFQERQVQSGTSPASDGPTKSFASRIKVLDPQGPLFRKWNKICVVTCVMAIFVDPLFFYVPVINEELKCLSLNRNLKITACVLRTFFDLFYILHMIFQFGIKFIPPSTNVFRTGMLIGNISAIVRRYLGSHFIIDILSIIPLPQMVTLAIIPIPNCSVPFVAKNLLKYTIIVQYVPRVLRLYLLFKEVTRTYGIMTKTAWSGAAFNLFIYMLASHGIGAFWYLLSVESEVRCWQTHLKHNKYSTASYLSCGQHYKQDVLSLLNTSTCAHVDPDNSTDSTVFNFGIFTTALQSRVVESVTEFPQKFFFCFWWGFCNLSSLGQNLQCSTYIWENIFAIFIAVLGLILFSSLIGIMQKYLQSTSLRVEEIRFDEMKFKRRDIERWMSHRMLPDTLKERIRRYEQYKWQQNRGVEEEGIIGSLPKDLRMDIKRHLCSDLLRRVPILEIMDRHLLDAMCARLKPVLYTENSRIVCKGDLIDEMLFIIRGQLACATTNVFFKAGDFCGEELITWAFYPNSSNQLPISRRSIETITEVEASVLMADDLKFVFSQFQDLNKNNEKIRHYYRFFSPQWRTWAACFIQVAWRQHRKKEGKESIHEAQELHAIGSEQWCSSSVSFASKVPVSNLSCKALQPTRSGKRKRMP
ncbi:hypothetical protein S245_028149 [Arachis hypogaea]